MKTSVIIPAAGLGKRFGSEIPKQFLEIDGIPMIIRTIKLFDRIDDVESIVIPVHNEWFTYTKELVAKFNCSKVKEITIGGKERQETVFNGLHLKPAQDSEIILIHDAVRPFTSATLIQSVIDAAEEYGAAIPAIAPYDTVKEKSSKEFVVKTLDRNKLVMAQTPQGYWTNMVIDAYTKGVKAGFSGTDSASFVEFIGYKVYIVAGEAANFKITTQADYNYAKSMLAE